MGEIFKKILHVTFNITQKMRIFQVITLSELGGAQSVVTSLANEIAKTDEVFVIAGGNGAMWDALSPSIRKISIPQLKRSISLLDIIVWIKLVYYYIKYKPNIINLHSSKIGLLGRLAFPRKKTFYTVHGFDSIRVAYRKFLPLEKMLSKRAHIIAVSDYDANNIHLEGIKGDVECIYNGIADMTESSKKTHTKELLCDTGFKVLCVARLAAPKRFDIFVETAKLLPDIKFFWVGNQNDIENLPENVFCLGQVPNAAYLNTQADVFMLSSNFEGMPISIIEALCCGKPVVASAVGSIPDILKHNNGYAVENNPQAFADKIKLLYTNKNLYDKMSLSARESYEKYFTLDIMKSHYVSVYKKYAKK